MAIHLAAALLALATAVASPSISIDGDIERFSLTNGARVLLLQIPGAGAIGIETFHETGFMDDPAGLPQVMHLIEHARCRGATGSFKAGESHSLFETFGLANAETLANFTHYDYVIVAGDGPPSAAALDEVLRAERERSTSLIVDRALIEQEMPRCDDEVAFVESAAGTPMLKFALMAAHQVWSHGAHDISIRSGISADDSELIAATHVAHYTPSALTLVVVGDFERDSTLASIHRHLGELPARPHRRPSPAPDWDALAADIRATWNSSRYFVLVAMPPPETRAERLAAGIWGEFLTMRLLQDDALAEVMQFGGGTATMYLPTDHTPIVFGGAPKDGVAPSDAAAVLRKRIRALASRPSTMIAQYFTQLEDEPRGISNKLITSQTDLLAAQIGGDVARARALVVGNIALQTGMRERLRAGVDGPAAIKEACSLLGSSSGGLMERWLAEPRMKTLILSPANADPATVD